MRNGETQVASYFCSGASVTSCFRAGGARARDLERQGGGGFDAVLAEIVGGGEPPTAECQHANPDPHGFGARDVAGLAVLGGDFPLADLEGAHVGVGDAAPRHRVERAQCQVFHRGNRAE